MYDSRRVVPGALFVAMQGGTTDGNRYVQAAQEQGASAIVTDSDAVWSKLKKVQPQLAVALVRHGRRALAELSAAFFQHPEKNLSLSGVTGTNGDHHVSAGIDVAQRGTKFGSDWDDRVSRGWGSADLSAHDAGVA
jgi:UDP-N-acetylmuramyl tripeptide synthase